jgi:hypothetical protein
MYYYKKTFVLKNSKERYKVNLLSYQKQIDDAVDKYNNVSNNSLNRKHIDVTILNDSLQFNIKSQRQLNPKYLGLSLRLFSQILVEDHGFISLCTDTNPKKLFITA